MPQAVSAVPETQALPWQHPVQEEGEQVVLGTQKPATHFSPDMHILHSEPLAPQAEVVFPAVHFPLRQQPLGQVQLLVEHFPWTHSSLPEQVLHRLPPVPQLNLEKIRLQWPLGRQQPPQLKGLHTPLSALPPPPSRKPGPMSSSEQLSRAAHVRDRRKNLTIFMLNPP